MNSIQVLLNFLGLLTVVVFLSWAGAKSNGCSAFNPDIPCTRGMRGEL